MTALPPVPKTIKFQAEFTDSADSDIRNIHYVSYTNTASAGDLQTMTNAFVAQWTTHMGPQQVTTVSLEQVLAQDLSSPTGAAALSGGGSAGTNSGTHLTSGACFVMSNEAQFRYRGGHSRTYITGIPSSGLEDANTWTTAFQTGMVNAWSAFWSAFLAEASSTALGTLAHVVAHRFGKTATAPVDVPGYRLVARSVPLTSPWTEPVVAYRTNPQVGSQRRRNMQAD
jgi:hypothetical protein